MSENEISYTLRGCIFEVFNILGPGLHENIYTEALLYELKLRGLEVKREVPLEVKYNGHILDDGFRIDLLIEDKVLVEVKSVEELKNVHHKIVLTYLKLSGIKLGIMVNFTCDDIEKSIFRKVNGLE